MKRIVPGIIVVVLTLIIVFTAIENDKVQGKKIEGEENEITIILPKYEPWALYRSYKLFTSMVERYGYQSNVPVRLVPIDTENYIQKRNNELYSNNGPTLIFIPMWQESYKDLANKGIGLDVQDKLENYDKIYESLKDEDHCYIPVGMYYRPIALNNVVLEELGLEPPDVDWTFEDYKEIREAWLKEEPRYFNSDQFSEIMNNPIITLDILDLENKRISLNNKQVKNYMDDVKSEVFSGKYIINKDYTYGNFVNLIYNRRSPESQDVEKLISDGSKRELMSYYNRDALNTLDSFADVHQIVLPEVRHVPTLTTWGFMVNKKGKNIEDGLKFIDVLISDESQKEMLITDVDIFPVNSSIEGFIEEQEKKASIPEEAIKLRKYIIKKIEAGEIASTSDIDEIYRYIEDKFKRLLVEYVFDDEPMSDFELDKKLQKLEDELNLWLNE